ncbi:hypothetical protein [Balneicella halophila]|nr:hypothetical protein [Balneicella halophila]
MSIDKTNYIILQKSMDKLDLQDTFHNTIGKHHYIIKTMPILNYKI